MYEAAAAATNNMLYQQQILQNHLKDNFQKNGISDVYFQNGEIISEYQQKPDSNIENTTESLEKSSEFSLTLLSMMNLKLERIALYLKIM
jgi:hypothetical protein